MEKKESFTVTEKYLDDVTSQSARALVGKIMKRFEILEDKDAIKKDIKELVYENSRELKALIRAFSYGVKFVSPKPNKNRS